MPEGSTDQNRASQEEPRIFPMRLQKFLARSGVASRRASENLMTAGRVKLNGNVITQLGTKVDPLKDIVEVDGVVVVWGSEAVYLILNKPAGYLTTMSDPQGRPCVAALVPCETYPGLYPVGRLDKDTRGLLLFSTNGEIGHGLLHPSHHVEKTYLARVEGVPRPGELEKLRTGVMLKKNIDGVLIDEGVTAPAKVDLLSQDEKSALLRISIHEGRNRQVRRMCMAIGHECLDLQRISFGPIKLDDLPEGQWRELSQSERDSLLSLIS
ncbi:MAG: rRNA pseudouridine synthase [Eggerthellaceae bacterium]|nr:rRNA pseudouridine synthase [Eggerthellaceae bacterium]